eukprot:Nk52_evm42s226 gene=Nk52_evmTU42s226
MPACIEKKYISSVEDVFVKQSGRQYCYEPAEKIPTVEVENFPALGKLTALRFLEWVQFNAGGVISLPTGKTPEHFIKWVQHYLRNWDSAETKEELKMYGIDASVVPDMKSLHFVQIDEFYPINPTQHNAFCDYVKKFYIEGFGLDPEKAMLIDTWTLGCEEGTNAGEVFPDSEPVDLTLRIRPATTPKEAEQKKVLEKVDQFCTEYESKIIKLGGIGFFLGGIGPDGHIAFNIAGSDHHSTTRLMNTNYETQAAASTDLGGIQVARRRLVITIGLATITFKKDAVAIIMAAGEAKAKKVAAAITCEPTNEHPATSLHCMPNSRFYVTRGAAKHLVERKFETFSSKASVKLTKSQIESILVDIALSLEKRIVDLTLEEVKNDRFGSAMLESPSCKGKDIAAICGEVDASLKAKIMAGCKEVTDTKIMHTAPHHDDIMLGYLPYVIHLVRPESNEHTFNYMTSGFNAVTNDYVIQRLNYVKHFFTDAHSDFGKKLADGYFNSDCRVGYLEDVQVYLDGVAGRNEQTKMRAEALRLCRILKELFSLNDVESILKQVDESIGYYKSLYAGQKDLPIYQKLKGMIREFEADLVWGYFGYHSNVNHLRLGFYKGDYFTEEPEVNRDVLPCLKVMKDTKPQVVSVAFDPEGSGPDTHYKVLQAVCEALRIYAADEEADNKEERKNIKVWGYRNVWFRFHPSEAELFVPVSLNNMAIMEDSFLNSFGSQRRAEFPAPEYDGPFNRYAQQIQAEQLQQMKVCLGRDYFEQHSSFRIRAAHGLNFIREMDLEEFFTAARSLKAAAENE